MDDEDLKIIMFAMGLMVGSLYSQLEPEQKKQLIKELRGMAKAFEDIESGKITEKDFRLEI